MDYTLMTTQELEQEWAAINAELVNRRYWQEMNRLAILADIPSAQPSGMAIMMQCAPTRADCLKAAHPSASP